MGGFRTSTWKFTHDLEQSLCSPGDGFHDFPKSGIVERTVKCGRGSQRTGVVGAALGTSQDGSVHGNATVVDDIDSGALGMV